MTEYDEKQIVIVFGDDWTGIYLNGKLLKEGSSFHNADILKLAEKYQPFKGDFFYCDPEWLENEGQFPVCLSDVIKDNI